MSHDDPGAARHARLGALFERALGVPPDQRAAFVVCVCGEDLVLREDLTSLLTAHEGAVGYFEALAADAVAPTLSALGDDPSADSGHDLPDNLRTSLAGIYRTERALAGGGMSHVWVVEDLELKRRVVLKVLRREMAPSANAERFHREIELTAQLQHPHIVPVLTMGTVDDTLYYTMPFVNGESLRERLEREGPLPLDHALRIWRDLLDALAYAHANGVIHRDVKPANILLSGRHALVTDFGISRAIESAAAGDGAPPAGMLFGTPAYMAPEEAAGEPEADHRVDIYQAGLVMYEMLTGAPPFAASSPEEYLRAHCTREPPPLTRLDASRTLIGLVMRCLAKNPSERPQSADAVLTEIERDVPEGVPPAGSRGRRRRVRRAVAFGLAGSGLLALGPMAVRFAGEPVSTAGAEVDRPAIAAYEWYRRGMDVSLLRTDSGRLRGVEYFERAIAVDSTYVDAYAGLVRMHVQLAHAASGPARERWLEQARRAALTAVRLDDHDADARAALGWVHLMSWDYEAAEAEFDRAIALDPRVPRGYEGLARVFMMTGRPAEQLRAARIAMDANPYSHSAVRELALALATNGRCEESLEELRLLKALTPPAGVAGVLRGQCFASRGMWPEAITEFQWATDHSATSALAFLGHALARAGRDDEAAAILSDLLDGRRYSHGSFGIAIVYAGMREHDRAFAWLDSAVADRTMSFYVMHPVFRDLHGDPRFALLRDRLDAPGP